MYFDRDSYQKSVRRAREERWRVRGRARVVHPKYGAVWCRTGRTTPHY